MAESLRFFKFVAEILTGALDAYSLYAVSDSFLRRKKIKFHSIIFIISMYIIININTLIARQFEGRGFMPMLCGLFCCVGFFLIMYLFFEGDYYNRINAILLYAVISGSADIIALNFSVIAGLYFESVSAEIITRAFVIVIRFAAILLIKYAAKKLKPVMDKNYGNNNRINVAFAFLIVMAVILLGQYIVTTAGKMQLWIFFVICVLVVGLFIFKYLKLSYRENLINEAQKLNAKVPMQQSEDMKQVVQKVRSIKHDMNNHMSVVMGLIRQEKYEELNEYLQAYQAETKGIYEYIILENKILATVLNNKRAIAQQNNIEFHCMVANDDLELSNLDIVTLFGNILDNAIEAATECENERYIDVKILGSERGHRIVCENSSVPPRLDMHGNIITNKDDKILHGIGMDNIREVINRYNGIYNYEYDKALKCFRVEVFLPYKREDGNV